MPFCPIAPCAGVKAFDPGEESICPIRSSPPIQTRMSRAGTMTTAVKYSPYGSCDVSQRTKEPNRNHRDPKTGLSLNS